MDEQQLFIILTLQLPSMKPYTLVLLFLFFTMEARSQTVDSAQLLIHKKCRTVHIGLPEDAGMAVGYPAIFNQIQVVDLRSDTSRAGIVRPDNSGQQEIVFRASTTRVLTSFLNFHYARPSGRQSLLVVVKDLWLSTSLDSVRERYDRRDHFEPMPVWNIAFRLEGYLQQEGGYIPLAYLDTVVVSPGNHSASRMAGELPGLFSDFMDKLAGIDLAAMSQRRRVVSFSQIDSFSRVRFSYPMDTATTFVKGVYANVDEFKNNRPSMADYVLTKDRSSNLELNIRDSDGKLYYTRTAWGVCDGKGVYVMMDGNLFPVFNVHHQFYILGSKLYSTARIGLPFFIPVTPATYAYGWAQLDETVLRKLQVFRLDVESGKVID